LSKKYDLNVKPISFFKFYRMHGLRQDTSPSNKKRKLLFKLYMEYLEGVLQDFTKSIKETEFQKHKNSLPEYVYSRDGDYIYELGLAERYLATRKNSEITTAEELATINSYYDSCSYQYHLKKASSIFSVYYGAKDTLLGSKEKYRYLIYTYKNNVIYDFLNIKFNKKDSFQSLNEMFVKWRCPPCIYVAKEGNKLLFLDWIGILQDNQTAIDKDRAESALSNIYDIAGQQLRDVMTELDGLVNNSSIMIRPLDRKRVRQEEEGCISSEYFIRVQRNIFKYVNELIESHPVNISYDKSNYTKYSSFQLMKAPGKGFFDSLENGMKYHLQNNFKKNKKIFKASYKKFLS